MASTQQLTVTVRDAASTVLTGRTVTYVSSNTAVATVSSSGLITAVGTGSCTITADCEGVQGTCTVTVSDPSAGFLVDTFTDTAGTGLALHTGETGATWSVHTGDPKVSSAGRVYQGTFSTNTYATASGTPPSADYYVTATLRRMDSSHSSTAGVGARLTTDQGGYWLRWGNVDGGVLLYKLVSGSATVLDTDTMLPTVGQDYTLRLEVEGTTIRGLIDGVEIVSATDSSFSSALAAGVSVYNGGSAGGAIDTVGTQLADITAGAL